MDNEDNLTVFNILNNVGFYSIKNYTGLKSNRMRDALYDLPKAIATIRNPLLPAIGKVEDSNGLEGEGIKIIIPSNIIDIYARLVLLGLKFPGHTDNLTEANNLIVELYKRGEIQNKQQYRNAPNKFQT